MLVENSFMKSLYLCYFGLREPLVQTQVLPYLHQLSSRGIDISLLTFEPHQNWSHEEIEGHRARLKAEGIRWFSLPYHKRPSAPATLYDIVAGAQFAARMVRRERLNVLHARAHVPMAMALLAQQLAKCQLIFDIRGLMAEEYADAGIWMENSLPFRMIKRVERVGIRRADQIVVLTRRMCDWLVQRRLKSAEQIEVIPCCVDFSRFNENQTDDFQPAPERFEVIYAGSVTGLYLLDEMGCFFLELRTRRPDAFLRILTVSSPTNAAVALQNVGLQPEDFWVGSASPTEVSAYLRRARLGLSFRKATFSQIAASPTKIPEYLAAGLPVVSNSGIGDTDELLETEGVGIIVRDFNQETFAKAVERALALAARPQIKAHCQEIARRRFDLVEVGGARYRKVYQQLAQQMIEEHPVLNLHH